MPESVAAPRTLHWFFSLGTGGPQTRLMTKLFIEATNS
jgi:hypothetical protein